MLASLVFWSNKSSELDCDCVVLVIVCPVGSVHSCLDQGAAVTTNSSCDRGLTLQPLLRINCVSNLLSARRMKEKFRFSKCKPAKGDEGNAIRLKHGLLYVSGSFYN